MVRTAADALQRFAVPCGPPRSGPARHRRELEAEGPPTTFFQPWDVRGDWTMRALEVGQSRVVEAAVVPDDASYRTMTWKSSDREVATVRPRMLDDIDPEKTRPTYRTKGEIVITGIAPGTARITATTTDGSHTATCEVRVVAAEPIE